MREDARALALDIAKAGRVGIYEAALRHGSLDCPVAHAGAVRRATMRVHVGDVVLLLEIGADDRPDLAIFWGRDAIQVVIIVGSIEPGPCERAVMK